MANLNVCLALIKVISYWITKNSEKLKYQDKNFVKSETEDVS